MRGMGMVVAGLAVVGATLPAQGQQAGDKARLYGAWLQTAPTWSVTAENPWTVMIFNPDGTFCGGSKKDNRYAEGTYGFDGERMTTISSTGRLSERMVDPGVGNRLVMHDPALDEPIVVVRTDMFASCAAMRAHQAAQ